MFGLIIKDFIGGYRLVFFCHGQLRRSILVQKMRKHALYKMYNSDLPIATAFGLSHFSWYVSYRRMGSHIRKRLNSQDVTNNFLLVQKMR